MLNGQLYINGKDAYLTWGIFLDETALSTLMTPAPNKEFISNKYRSKDGKSVIKHNPRLDEREITLPFNMTAKDSDTFMTNYARFCEEVLAKGSWLSAPDFSLMYGIGASISPALNSVSSFGKWQSLVLNSMSQTLVTEVKQVNIQANDSD